MSSGVKLKIDFDTGAEEDEAEEDSVAVLAPRDPLNLAIFRVDGMVRSLRSGVSARACWTRLERE